jgi:putative FmdB family regulatory protein
MPRYSYKCDDCDEVSNVFHSIDDTLKECPNCKSENLNKLLSVVTILKKEKSNKKQIGQITKEYILANKEILKNQKKEAEEEEYEPT